MHAKHPILKHRSVLAFDLMSQRDVTAVLTSANTPQRAAEAGETQPLLRRKNLALLCQADDDGEATLFRLAAVELGAHVTGLASQDLPTAKLAELLGSNTSPADNRRFVLQAVLLRTIA